MYMNLLAEILAQAPAAPAAASAATTTAATGAGQTGQAVQPNWMQTPFPMIIVMIVIFYFVLIRPQQKRAKQQAALLKGLKSGDRVATASGIIGVVVSVKDNTVSLRSADTKLEVTKVSITEILNSDTPAAS
jgi:preprotein translocase subunit YajC